MAEKLVIELDLETGEFKSELDQVAKVSKKKGKKAGDNFSDGFESQLKDIAKVAGVVAGALASIGAGLTLKKSIDAAQVQEDAINRLNSALEISGKFSEQASQDLQDYASSLQQVTRFGDEAILSSQALIQSLGNLSKDELKDATKATLDLAAALKIDLNAAATLVGKAAAGEVGSFSRYGLSIKKAENNTKTFARALDAIEEKFGGAAANDVKTFSGSVEQLSNTFGDLLEEFGFAITKSPIVLSGIDNLNKAIKSAIGITKAFIDNFRFIEDLVNPLSKFNDAIISFVVAPLELAKNIASTVFSAITFAINQQVASLGFLGSKVADLLNLFGVSNGLTDGLKTFGESSAEVAKDSADKFKENFTTAFDFDISTKLAEKNEELAFGLTAFNETITMKSDEISTNLAGTVKESVDTIANSGNTLKTIWEGLSFGVTKASKDISKQTQKTASIVKGALVKGIAGGVQTVTNALLKGENAFEAFGQFILGVFGDLAIQLGQFFIAQGIAINATKAIDGSGAIAAGAGLVALGTILKSFAGGSSDAGSSASGGGGAIGDTVTAESAELTEPDNVVQSEPNTAVQLIVQGDVLDTQETGTKLATTLSEAFNKQGVALTDFRTA